MAAIPVVIQRAVKYFAGSGAGTSGDPYILQVSGGGGGGGGSDVQYADGATAATPTGNQINWNDAGVQRAVSTAKPLPVSGAFYQTTQPVSAASLPLPTGAATATNQATANTSLSSLDTKLGEVQASPTANTVLDRLKAIYTALTGTLTVATHAVTQSGTWNINNVSGTVSLPTGAATAAKQPALGTAGSASSDVLTVQGIPSMTALKTDGSAVTQPISIALPTNIYSGKTTVTTVGTRVPLASSQAIASGVTIKALVANTGIIYIGNSSVASSNGHQLAAGDSVFLEIANLNTVNLDSSVNGEGVTYLAS